MINEVGNEYGKLTVVRENGRDKSGNILWFCSCECGGTKTVIATKLRLGRVTSCGCLLSLPEGQAAFNTLYARYRRGARDRNLVFELTKEDFSFLTKMNCHYCGVEPEKISQSSNKNKPYNGDYIYNGIDRIDNNKGYTMDNVVPCCEICNNAKKNLSKVKFISWLDRICVYRVGGNQIVHKP